MKILHLSTGVSKQSAVYRLHKALQKQNERSYIYTGLKSVSENDIINTNNEFRLKVTARTERLLLKLYPWRLNTPWNLGFFNNCFDEVIDKINPDVIHLHWINQFVSIKQIARFKKPIVWTLHDSWPFTGGCHIPGSCDQFKTKCNKCPQLGSTSKADLSNLIFGLKKSNWRGISLNIIGPSKWMCNQAASSDLFADKYIANMPNCIDTEFYVPIDKLAARAKLNFSKNTKIIMFGANNAALDNNKGYKFILEAFAKVRQKIKNVELVVFGSKSISWCEHSKIREIGFINDSNIFPALYSSADLLINASMSENFSNVILESLSCGTPVVAFDIGGNSDLINNEDAGLLVTPFNTNELACKIVSALSKTYDQEIVRSHVVRNFNELEVANKHIKFYKSLCS